MYNWSVSMIELWGGYVVGVNCVYVCVCCRCGSCGVVLFVCVYSMWLVDVSNWLYGDVGLCVYFILIFRGCILYYWV